MVRVLKLATPHYVKRTKRNNQLLLCEAPKPTINFQANQHNGNLGKECLNGFNMNSLCQQLFVEFPSDPERDSETRVIVH